MQLPPDPSSPPRSTTELQRLHDWAHEEARRLRAEALADFWRGADALLVSATGSAQRAATRLAARLKRRHATPHPV
jgi:phosphoserine phosphatase